MKPSVQIFVTPTFKPILKLYVYGIISNKNSGKGITFYRTIMKSAVIGNVIFGVFFLLIYKGGMELIWDRLIFILVGLFLIQRSYKRQISSTRYTKWCTIFIYANTIQIIWTLAYNEFNGYYFLALLITVQVFSFSLRNERVTFWYLLFVCTSLFAALYFFKSTSELSKGLNAIVIFVMSALQYFSARLKCTFLQQMKVHQDLLKSLVSKTEDAIFLTDLHGNIHDVNFRVHELFGYENSELIDSDFKMMRKFDLTPSDINIGLVELETNRFWTTETILVKKGGEEFPARLSITLIESGDRRSLVYRALDISVHKENESNLIESKNKAEEAMRAKGQFLAVMSHEIRTPLNGVIATASLIQNTNLDFEQEEYVSTIKKSGQSLLMLINDILEFSKMENEKMELEIQTGKIDDAVFDVTDLLRPHAESKGIELEVNIDSEIRDYFQMDFHRLKQVMFNLIGNSIKFTNQGRVVVSVGNLEINRDKAIIHFEIRDTGIGIAEDKMHLLFQSFSQLDSSTSRKYGGTGLGLAISKQLIELMGGDIQVKSKINEGSVFSFTVHARITDEKQVGEDTLLLPNESDFNFSAVKALVAEDNEINIQVLKFILDSLKIKADFVVDGEKAIEKCEFNMYDIIFMDLNMPKMDGLLATQYIRSHFKWQPPIVAISANSADEDRKLCLDAGMNDFLAKPFELEPFKAIIRKWSNPSCAGIVSAA